MSIAQIAPLVRGAYLDRLGVPVAVTRVAGDDEPGYKLDVAPVEGLRPEGSDWSIGLVEAAGFELVAASEINANPRDTADHPQGVWEMKPSWRTKRAELENAGESDRMTLLFRKR